MCRKIRVRSEHVRSIQVNVRLGPVMPGQVKVQTRSGLFRARASQDRSVLGQDISGHVKSG